MERLMIEHVVYQRSNKKGPFTWRFYNGHAPMAIGDENNGHDEALQRATENGSDEPDIAYYV
jgi:hypothetical protein